MAITLADFTKIWADTSPLTPYSFSESNYKEGWNFIGSTPPARQMWDSIQKQNDEKLKYIVDNFLPLSGGTMTGDVTLDGGAVVGNPLTLTADDGNGNIKSFVANADGTLTWDGNNVLTDNTVGTVVSDSTSNGIALTANTPKTITSISLSAGTWVVTGHLDFTSVTAGNSYGGYVGTTADSFSYSDDGTASVQSSSNKGISVNPTTILKLTATTTVYLCGYSNVAGNVAYSHINAVRIV